MSTKDLGSTANMRRKKTWAEWWISLPGVLALTGTIYATVLFGLFFLENAVLSPEVAKDFQIWSQYVTGSWPAHWESLSALGFYSGYALSVLLTAGPFFGVLALISKLITIEKREAMTYANMMNLRDALTADHFLSHLNEEKFQGLSSDMKTSIIETLRLSAEEAKKEWLEGHLPIFVGEASAKAIQERTIQKSS